MEKSLRKLERKKVIKEAFSNTLDSLSFVFKNLTLYFAIYYISLAVAILFSIYALFPFASFGMMRIFFPMLLNMAAMAFTIFITPYYVRLYQEKSSQESFWDFVKETVMALVINHIKKVCVVFLYILFLIVPGIVKAVRLIFVTQTTFFDKDCREGRLSALKASSDLTKGFFWPLILVFICVGALISLSSMLVKFGLKQLFAGLDGLPFSAIVDSLGLTADFYISNLMLIFVTQLYFSLRKAQSSL